MGWDGWDFPPLWKAQLVLRVFWEQLLVPLLKVHQLASTQLAFPTSACDSWAHRFAGSDHGQKALAKLLRAGTHFNKLQSAASGFAWIKEEILSSKDGWQCSYLGLFKIALYLGEHDCGLGHLSRASLSAPSRFSLPRAYPGSSRFSGAMWILPPVTGTSGCPGQCFICFLSEQLEESKVCNVNLLSKYRTAYNQDSREFNSWFKSTGTETNSLHCGRLDIILHQNEYWSSLIKNTIKRCLIVTYLLSVTN